VGPGPNAGDQDLVRLYLDGIGQYPLLTPAEEVKLARAIEAGHLAEAQLASGEDLFPDRERRLIELKRGGDRATDRFVNANLRLVVSIAKRYRTTDMPLLDQIQEGNLGLMRAVEKFDWRRGFKFSTYATWWIRQAISRGIDNTSRTVRLPVHASDQARRVQRVRSSLEGQLGRSPTASELAGHLQVSEAEIESLLVHMIEPVSLDSPVGSEGDAELADVVADPSAPTPFDVAASHMLGAEIERLLGQLDRREAQVLRLRYGLDRGEPRTLEEVGAELSLTRERIRQIERSALDKLRAHSLHSGARDLLAS
jgi:RNA polymerase sigma factor (sigma-70 family)